MRVVVNGEQRELPESTTVASAVAELAIESPAGVAVAVDGDVVPRAEWDRVVLEPDQRVEVVRAVQGG